MLWKSGCAYAGPAEISVGPLTIWMLNQTPGDFDLDLWLLNEVHEYDELAAHIEEEHRRGEAGEEPLGHPTFATLVAETSAEPGSASELVTRSMSESTGWRASS